jgi:hypothetical protein
MRFLSAMLDESIQLTTAQINISALFQMSERKFIGHSQLLMTISEALKIR